MTRNYKKSERGETENESKKNDFSLYQKLNSMLTVEGVCVDIIYRHIFDGSITHDSIQKIKEVGNIALSLVAVPEYPGILHRYAFSHVQTRCHA